MTSAKAEVPSAVDSIAATTSALAAAPKVKLLDQVRREIRLRHYSLRTEDAYVNWIRRFILFHRKRHPRDMGAAEVRGFLELSKQLKNRGK